MKIKITKIKKGFNSRSDFSDAEIEGLAESIKIVGLLSPIIVRPLETNDGYELMAGYRRLAAAVKLAWEEIEANVIEANNDLAALINATENLQRENLTIQDESQMIAGFYNGGAGIADIATLLGKSKAFVETRLALDKLSPELFDLLQSQHITISQALKIARFGSDVQDHIRAEIIKQERPTDSILKSLMEPNFVSLKSRHFKLSSRFSYAGPCTSCAFMSDNMLLPGTEEQTCFVFSCFMRKEMAHAIDMVKEWKGAFYILENPGNKLFSEIYEIIKNHDVPIILPSAGNKLLSAKDAEGHPKEDLTKVIVFGTPNGRLEFNFGLYLLKVKPDKSKPEKETKPKKDKKSETPVNTDIPKAVVESKEEKEAVIANFRNKLHSEGLLFMDQQKHFKSTADLSQTEFALLFFSFWLHYDPDIKRMIFEHNNFDDPFINDLINSGDSEGLTSEMLINFYTNMPKEGMALLVRTNLRRLLSNKKPDPVIAELFQKIITETYPGLFESATVDIRKKFNSKMEILESVEPQNEIKEEPQKEVLPEPEPNISEKKPKAKKPSAKPSTRRKWKNPDGSIAPIEEDLSANDLIDHIYSDNGDISEPAPELSDEDLIDDLPI